jgi:hypothetical protein
MEQHSHVVSAADGIRKRQPSDELDYVDFLPALWVKISADVFSQTSISVLTCK